MDKVKGIIEGYLYQWCYNLVIDEEDKAVGLERLAHKIWERHGINVAGVADKDRVNLRPYDQIKEEIVQQMLDPKRGMRPEMAKVLATKLNRSLPAATNAPPAISPFIQRPSAATNTPLRTTKIGKLPRPSRVHQKSPPAPSPNKIITIRIPPI